MKNEEFRVYTVLLTGPFYDWDETQLLHLLVDLVEKLK